MGAELAAIFPSASETFQRADQLLGIPLSQIAWEGPADTLNDTINTQPALLVHSIAVWRVFTETYPDFTPAYVAGHSMGELSALAAAGALSYEAALPLVRARGEAMKSAGERSPGGMAAILGLDMPTLEAICAQASQPGDAVQVANDNCPGQVVISGTGAALERALELARQSGARRAVRLAVSIAAHSDLMLHAQAQFNQAVEAAPINHPTIPIIGNINASPLTNQEEIRADLLAQLTTRVRWTESIQWLVAQGVTTFIEMGSEAVLTGLLRRIARDAQGLALGSPADFEKFAALL
jgi:[acyl-carrier-protein] S-malonyltransferase